MSGPTNTTQTFKLTKFSPIGFKMVNYPVQYCSLCRGYLTDVCCSCMEKKCDKCDVINNNGNYYHNHCYIFNNQKPVVKKPVAKKRYYSESESD